jgi:type II secretion system protein H
MMRHRTTRDDGFTLLELLAVLIIAAAALAFAMPVITGSRGERAIRTTTSAIVATLNQTRSRAMTTGRPVSFSIDTTLRAYRWDDGETVELPAGMTFSTSGGPQLIVFRPDGTATPAEFGLNQGRLGARIGVDWLTGRASVSFER